MSLAKPRVLLGLLAIIAVSCRGGDGDRRVAAKPVPLLEGATKGTGARLPNGFRVAAGSLLLGDAFPRRGDPATGEQQTWDALFIVAGDPKDVMEDYVRQAQAAGFSLTEGSCSGVRPPEVGLRCEAGLDKVRPYPEFGETVDIVLRRAPKTASSPSFSDLRFTYRETDPVTSPFPLPSGRKFERGVVEVALPTRWEPLPQTGEPVAKRVHVVEGSHLVGPVLFGDCGIWGGFNAVLAVTADFDRVTADYARQMTVSVGGPVGRLDHDEEYRKQGARVVIYSYDGAWVIGVERGDERYVFLSRCSEHEPR